MNAMGSSGNSSRSCKGRTAAQQCRAASRTPPPTTTKLAVCNRRRSGLCVWNKVCLATATLSWASSCTKPATDKLDRQFVSQADTGARHAARHAACSLHSGPPTPEPQRVGVLTSALTGAVAVALSLRHRPFLLAGPEELRQAQAQAQEQHGRDSKKVRCSGYHRLQQAHQ